MAPADYQMGETGDDQERRDERRAAARARRTKRRRAVFALGAAVVVALIVIAALALRDGTHRRQHGPYLIGAWTYGDRPSLKAAVAAGAIDEVSVNWLQSRPDGSVVAPQADDAYIKEAKKQDCRVMVTLTDYNEATKRFDPAIANAILASSDLRQQHVATIAGWCDEHKVDGVDVDWESLKASQREAFTLFMTELSRRLHDDGRRLSVAVYAKTSEPGGWDGPQSHDYKRLGAVVDQFRIMTYDYSGSWSDPGPIAPLEWVDHVLTFAETQVPRERIVMGLPFYGRDWRGRSTTDLAWSSLQALRTAHSPSSSRHASQELRLAYRRDGAQHVAFFNDSVAVRAKIDLLKAKHPRIRGVYAWRMGLEDPEVWRQLRAVLTDF